MAARLFGFTLIELLIVVAIIAILAAIAVPNFLEAQVRSKATRARSDMRTIAGALEAYRLDHNTYPVVPNDAALSLGDVFWFYPLSTPVAYIALDSVGEDPFNATDARTKYRDRYDVVYGSGDHFGYSFANLELRNRGQPWAQPPHWVLTSKGPDKGDGPQRGGGHGSVAMYTVDPVGNGLYVDLEYDSSNGTRSGGDILRWGP